MSSIRKILGAFANKLKPKAKNDPVIDLPATNENENESFEMQDILPKVTKTREGLQEARSIAVKKRSEARSMDKETLDKFDKLFLKLSKLEAELDDEDRVDNEDEENEDIDEPLPTTRVSTTARRTKTSINDDIPNEYGEFVEEDFRGFEPPKTEPSQTDDTVINNQVEATNTDDVLSTPKQPVATEQPVQPQTSQTQQTSQTSETSQTKETSQTPETSRAPETSQAPQPSQPKDMSAALLEACADIDKYVQAITQPSSTTFVHTDDFIILEKDFYEMLSQPDVIKLLETNKTLQEKARQAEAQIVNVYSDTFTSIANQEYSKFKKAIEEDVPFSQASHSLSALSTLRMDFIKAQIVNAKNKTEATLLIERNIQLAKQLTDEGNFFDAYSIIFALNSDMQINRLIEPKEGKDKLTGLSKENALIYDYLRSIYCDKDKAESLSALMQHYSGHKLPPITPLSQKYAGFEERFRVLEAAVDSLDDCYKLLDQLHDLANKDLESGAEFKKYEGQYKDRIGEKILKTRKARYQELLEEKSVSVAEAKEMETLKDEISRLEKLMTIDFKRADAEAIKNAKDEVNLFIDKTKTAKEAMRPKGRELLQLALQKTYHPYDDKNSKLNHISSDLINDINEENPNRSRFEKTGHFNFNAIFNFNESMRNVIAPYEERLLRGLQKDPKERDKALYDLIDRMKQEFQSICDQYKRPEIISKRMQPLLDRMNQIVPISLSLLSPIERENAIAKFSKIQDKQGLINSFLKPDASVVPSPDKAPDKVPYKAPDNITDITKELEEEFVKPYTGQVEDKSRKLLRLSQTPSLSSLDEAFPMLTISASDQVVLNHLKIVTDYIEKHKHDTSDLVISKKLQALNEVIFNVLNYTNSENINTSPFGVNYINTEFKKITEAPEPVLEKLAPLDRYREDVILIVNHNVKCDVIKVNQPLTLQTLKTLPINSASAYVRFEDKVYWVNKESNLIKPLSWLREDSREIFDKKLEPTEEAKMINGSTQLQQVILTTGHNHEAYEVITKNKALNSAIGKVVDYAFKNSNDPFFVFLYVDDQIRHNSVLQQDEKAMALLRKFKNQIAKNAQNPKDSPFAEKYPELADYFVKIAERSGERSEKLYPILKTMIETMNNSKLSLQQKRAALDELLNKEGVYLAITKHRNTLPSILKHKIKEELHLDSERDAAKGFKILLGLYKQLANEINIESVKNDPISRGPSAALQPPVSGEKHETPKSMFTKWVKEFYSGQDVMYNDLDAFRKTFYTNEKPPRIKGYYLINTFDKGTFLISLTDEQKKTLEHYLTEYNKLTQAANPYRFPADLSKEPIEITEDNALLACNNILDQTLITDGLQDQEMNTIENIKSIQGQLQNFLLSINPDFKELTIGKKAITSYPATPVQRAMRYVLLLKEGRKYGEVMGHDAENKLLDALVKAEAQNYMLNKGYTVVNPETHDKSALAKQFPTLINFRYKRISATTTAPDQIQKPEDVPGVYQIEYVETKTKEKLLYEGLLSPYKSDEENEDDTENEDEKERRYSDKINDPYEVKVQQVEFTKNKNVAQNIAAVVANRMMGKLIGDAITPSYFASRLPVGIDESGENTFVATLIYDNSSPLTNVLGLQGKLKDNEVLERNEFNKRFCMTDKKNNVIAGFTSHFKNLDKILAASLFVGARTNLSDLAVITPDTKPETIQLRLRDPAIYGNIFADIPKFSQEKLAQFAADIFNKPNILVDPQDLQDFIQNVVGIDIGDVDVANITKLDNRKLLALQEQVKFFLMRKGVVESEIIKTAQTGQLQHLNLANMIDLHEDKNKGFREYARDYHSNLGLAKAFDAIVATNVQAEIDSTINDVGKTYGYKPMRQFAKDLGVDVSGFPEDDTKKKDQLIIAIKTFLDKAFKAAKENLKELADEVKQRKDLAMDMNLSALFDAKNYVDMDPTDKKNYIHSKLKQYFEENPEYFDKKKYRKHVGDQSRIKTIKRLFTEWNIRRAYSKHKQDVKAQNKLAQRKEQFKDQIQEQLGQATTAQQTKATDSTATTTATTTATNVAPAEIVPEIMAELHPNPEDVYKKPEGELEPEEIQQQEVIAQEQTAAIETAEVRKALNVALNELTSMNIEEAKEAVNFQQMREIQLALAANREHIPDADVKMEKLQHIIAAKNKIHVFEGKSSLSIAGEKFLQRNSKITAENVSDKQYAKILLKFNKLDHRRMNKWSLHLYAETAKELVSMLEMAYQEKNPTNPDFCVLIPNFKNKYIRQAIATHCAAFPSAAGFKINYEFCNLMNTGTEENPVYEKKYYKEKFVPSEKDIAAHKRRLIENIERAAHEEPKKEKAKKSEVGVLAVVPSGQEKSQDRKQNFAQALATIHQASVTGVSHATSESAKVSAPNKFKRFVASFFKPKNATSVEVKSDNGRTKHP